MAREFLAAFRWLRRNPLFTLAVTAILALGIGANTAIFSIVDAVLLRPSPYEAASRMVRIEETSTKKPLNRIPGRHYQTWSARADLFEKTAGHSKAPWKSSPVNWSAKTRKSTPDSRSWCPQIGRAHV